MKVAVFMGSKSDVDAMKGTGKALKEFNVDFEAYVMSAHRIPEKLIETVSSLEENDFECVIAGAGLSAHLPGVIAAHTSLPVIGVPINSQLGGLDALYSIVQMPKSIPVATVGINNSYNAGMLAVEILAVKYPELKKALKEFRNKMKENFINDNSEGVEL